MDPYSVVIKFQIGVHNDFLMYIRHIIGSFFADLA